MLQISFQDKNITHTVWMHAIEATATVIEVLDHKAWVAELLPRTFSRSRVLHVYCEVLKEVRF